MTAATLARRLRAPLGDERQDEVRTLAGGTARRRRVYLDSTATCLMPELVWDGLRDYLERACANSHTTVHRAGRATTASIEEARDAIGRLVGYDPARDTVLLSGNGATGAINFLARALFPPELRLPLRRCPEGPPRALLDAIADVFPAGADTLAGLLARPLVVTTVMEHHSNILPWVEAVGRHHTRFVDVRPDGRLDLEHLRAILAAEGGRVRLVAVAGASNVTGVVNPIHEIAALAHAHGALILVDAAQLAPHRPIAMHPGGGGDLDFLVLSGHKLYAPGSRGALIGRVERLDRRCIGDLGGGAVEYVSLDDFRLKDEITAREEAGTPNIPGTIALGLAAEALARVGMDAVASAEHELVGDALERLAALPDVRVYGPGDPRARVGVIAFTVAGLHHGLVATFLDDFFNVAVRNECFCAHPYVKALLAVDAAREQAYLAALEAGDRRHVPGMVRLSFGLYSTRADVDVVVEALRELVAHRDRVVTDYQVGMDGDHHLRGAPPRAPAWLPSRFLDGG